MRKEIAVIAGAAVTMASAASAHDFWLEPATYAAAEGESVAVRFMIGHGDEHEPWNLQLEKVAELKSCVAARCEIEADIVPNAGGAIGRAQVAFRNAETRVLAFESKPSFSELEASRFTDYAKKEGLSAILADRAKRGLEGRPGRELYSRRAKTLIHVGDATPGDVSIAIGHTLEILPLKNPLALKAGDMFPVRVLFNGAPLSGATIDLDDLSDAQGPLRAAITDADGAANFRIEGAGPFKLMTIWGVPLEDRRRADYETFFASLTFGS